MLLPSTNEVPETSTLVSGSAATAFTTAKVERAGKVTEPPDASKPFTVNEDNVVLEDLATTTVTV